MTTERNDPEASISRVVVALAGADSPSSLVDTAIFVATAFQAELSGLYIEEESLLDLSDLPAAVIQRSGARGPKLTGRDQLRSAWQRQARGFREHLLVGASRHRVRCSFATRSGDTLACLTEATGGRDLVAIPGGHDLFELPGLWDIVHAAARSAHSVMLSARRFVPEPGAPILAIDDGDLPGAETIGFAAAIASATGHPLHVLALAEPRDVGRIAARAREITGSMKPVVHPLSIWVRDQIPAAVARLRPMLVIADLSGAPFEDAARARKLLRALDVPLILLAPGKPDERGCRTPGDER